MLRTITGHAGLTSTSSIHHRASIAMRVQHEWGAAHVLASLRILRPAAASLVPR
jgi:hypothetical protein